MKGPGSGPVVSETVVPGLLHVQLEVHADERGWFKESFQQAKLEAAGLPHHEVVQHNVSYNAQAGVARGVHAEPWAKWVSPVHGRVFSAVVDLRDGPGFGAVATFELGPDAALYVPRGCGNAFCSLEPHTVYDYLVDAHWSPTESYLAVDLFDPDLAIAWPFPREQLLISAKDAANPPLAAVRPVPVPG